MMAEILKHPLLVLLVGAVLSGLVIPFVTRRWQDRQKSLELKTGLVTEVSEAVMKIMMAVQFVHIRAGSFKQEDFDQAYRDWEVKSAIIGTKLQAYFPQTAIPSEWGEFTEVITNFYALEGISDTERRQALAASVCDKLSIQAESDYERLWGLLREKLLLKKSDLIQRILHSKIHALRAG